MTRINEIECIMRGTAVDSKNTGASAFAGKLIKIPLLGFYLHHTIHKLAQTIQARSGYY